MDPARIDVRGNLSVGQDSIIDINCVFSGDVTIGDNVSIGPNCSLTNASVASGTVIKANTVIEDSSVGENCTIGPFARLRPCLLYTSPSPRDKRQSRMPSSA